MAWLNVDADRLAEAAHALPAPQLWMLPNEKIALKIGGRRVTRRFRAAIREAAGLQELKETIIERAKWSDAPENFDAVDWPMHARAQRKLSKHRKVMVTKLQHDLLATMYRKNKTQNRKRQEEEINPKCPRCTTIHETNETMDHVWSCPSEMAIEERRLQWRKTRETIRKFQTPNYLLDKFQSGIQQWQENQGEVEWRYDEWGEPTDPTGAASTRGCI